MAKTKKTAKAMVMIPEFRQRVVPDHKKYNRCRNKKELKESLKDMTPD